MDIVEQLRWCGLGFPKFKTNRGDYGICDDAADEIERLRNALQEIFEHDSKMNDEYTFISVVAKMNLTWAGGSSKVFNNALKALLLSM